MPLAYFAEVACCSLYLYDKKRTKACAVGTLSNFADRKYSEAPIKWDSYPEQKKMQKIEHQTELSCMPTSGAVRRNLRKKMHKRAIQIQKTPIASTCYSVRMVGHQRSLQIYYIYCLQIAYCTWAPGGADVRAAWQKTEVFLWRGRSQKGNTRERP